MMTNEEIRNLVASNAQVIERMEENFERLYNRTDERIATVYGRIELISRQLQAIADRQESSDGRIIVQERMMNGVFDILRTSAEAQAKRSELIDQQIQALIGGRRSA